jgi:hypothetical protein
LKKILRAEFYGLIIFPFHFLLLIRKYINGASLSRTLKIGLLKKDGVPFSALSPFPTRTDLFSQYLNMISEKTH